MYDNAQVCDHILKNHHSSSFTQYELVGELFQMSDPAGMFAPRKRASSRVGRNAPKGKKTVGSEVCISQTFYL